jgi:hypothetical protein
MNVLQNLEADVRKWADAIEDREQRAEHLRRECARLIGESIDLSETEARKSRKQRGEHLTELDLLDAELSELTRRHEAAKAAVKEYQVNQAEAIYQQADQEAREARLAVDAALNERLRFMNQGGRKGESDASIEEKKNIEIKLANAQAASRIASRNRAEAGRVLQELRQ